MEGPVRGVVFCHCSQCLRTHGHTAAYTSVDKRAMTLTASTSLKWFNSSKVVAGMPGVTSPPQAARRGFCGTCGASIFYETLAATSIEVSAGTVDQPTSLRHVGHIFAGSKADYYDITDDKPAFECDDDDCVLGARVFLVADDSTT